VGYEHFATVTMLSTDRGLDGCSGFSRGPATQGMVVFTLDDG
jgi:hypothetical protein